MPLTTDEILDLQREEKLLTLNIRLLQSRLERESKRRTELVEKLRKHKLQDVINKLTIPINGEIYFDEELFHLDGIGKFMHRIDSIRWQKYRDSKMYLDSVRLTNNDDATPVLWLRIRLPDHSEESHWTTDIDKLESMHNRLSQP